jgi:transposase-like protein
MECKFCGQTCQRAGRQKNRAQKYYCSTCRKYQQLQYKYAACNKNIEPMISSLVCESVSIRGIARVLKISVVTVCCKIRRIAASIKKPAIPLRRKAFELDEVRPAPGAGL